MDIGELVVFIYSFFPPSNGYWRAYIAFIYSFFHQAMDIGERSCGFPGRILGGCRSCKNHVSIFYLVIVAGAEKTMIKRSCV